MLFAVCTHAVAQVPRASRLWQNTYRSNQTEFPSVALFANQPLVFTDITLKEAMVLQLSQTTFNHLLDSAHARFTLVLPAMMGAPVQLKLERCLTAPGELPMIGTMGDALPVRERAGGMHYRGYIAGDTTSLAALSLFDDGTIMGLFSGKAGNWVLGNYKQAYVLYNAAKLKLPASGGCHADDSRYGQLAAAFSDSLLRVLDAPATLCRKVRFYWEADFNLYRYSFNGNLNATRNYLVGVFNMTAALFQNEGIVVELSEANIWTSLDPYRNNTSDNALADFKQMWNNLGNSFNGDIAHLVCGGPANNGGLAYINVLCNRNFGYAYSNVFGQYNAFPTFSFDVEILAHETGHNMGSPHTHWCGWNTSTGGTCGAIDNCGPIEAGASCQTCPATNVVGTLGWSGTVMSYCYVVNNVGVNFSNGFGPLPRAVIRNAVNTNNCLTTKNAWTGTTDTVWAKTSNWGCGIIPTATTDVVITAAVPHLPVVTGNAICRSILLQPASLVKVNMPANLQIAGGRLAPITPAPPSQSLFITGTSTPAGWMVNGDAPVVEQQFYRLTPTLYIINALRLNGGGALAFVPQYGNMGSRYGFAGAALTNIRSGDAFVAGGNDLRGPADTGFYRILVDFQRSRYSIYPAPPLVPLPASAELFITGSATPAGWMSNGNAPVLTQKFTRINSTLYELANIRLTAGGSFLLVPVYGNWNDKYGGMGAINNTNISSGDFFQRYGSDLLAAPVTGNYKVIVDFQTGRYQLLLL